MGKLKKKKHNLKLCFIQDLTEDYGLEASFSAGFEGLFQRGKGRVRMYRSFGQEKKKTKKTPSHFKLMILVHSCVWENARIEAFSTHSFDTHLNNLGVSCFSPS